MRTRLVLVVMVMTLAAACGGDRKPKGDGGHPAERWPVTAWGERYEIFAETDPLVAGSPAGSGVHVTVLAGFTPLAEGSVTALLRSAGKEQEFSSREVIRPGIFRLTIQPPSEGEYEFAYRVESAAGSEEIPAGRVRVGSSQHPGGVADADEGDLPAFTSFLKEQQWRTSFATAWAREGGLHASVSGPARILPAGDGEVVLTAPVAGRVSGTRWPHPGMEVRQGDEVIALLPRTGSERSVAELEAAVRVLEAEHGSAAKRAQRLERLLKVEATSVREAEEAQSLADSSGARLDAARTDLATARTTLGAAGTRGTPLRAPFAGRVAAVSVTPGAAVDAGSPLVRLVRVFPVWVEVGITPGNAGRLAGDPAGLVLGLGGGSEPVEIPAGRVRLVARSPEVDPGTGLVKVLLEVDGSLDTLPLGSSVSAEVLLPRERTGVVMPSSAVIDDAGVAVVWVQQSGESFERRPVTVEVRQGSLVLVGGVRAGERVVVSGGQAIRRAELLSSGSVEGHVH